jgi:hypothetical protein
LIQQIAARVTCHQATEIPRLPGCERLPAPGVKVADVFAKIGDRARLQRMQQIEFRILGFDAPAA